MRAINRITSLKRPKFATSFLAALIKSERRRGWRAFIPISLCLCLFAGVVVSYFIDARFWNYDKLEVAAGIYVGLLTLNGLILALSWSAFARMHDSIVSFPFSDYLLKNDLLNDYLFYIQFINVIQIVAMIVSAISLLLLLCDIPALYNRILFAIMIGISVYAIKYAAAAITAMHDLIWQKAIFDGHQKQDKPETVIRVRREEMTKTTS